MINKYAGASGVQDNVSSSGGTLTSDSPTDGVDEPAWKKARRDMTAKHISINISNDHVLQQYRLVNALYLHCIFYGIIMVEVRNKSKNFNC
jgi:hypothetical protein